MDAQLEVKLIECLDALAQGDSVEQILARYPQDAAQLRPLLQTAAGLPALRMEPSEAMKMSSRRKFMAQADVLRHTPKHKTMGFLPRFATGFVAAGLVAIVLSTGAVAASGSALPGDPLYNVKRTVENVRLSAAGDPSVRDELQREFDQRRRDETNELLDAGRESEVEFTGLIESIQPKAWIIGGLVVEMNANTSIAGIPQINQAAEVQGVTGPGGLRATSITIRSNRQLEKTPEAEGTATPESIKDTETPEPTLTPVPTAAAVPTGTPAPAAIGAPSVTPRPTASPRPTVAPPTAAPPTAAPPTAVVPTETPEPVEVEFTGNVKAIDTAIWNIDGSILGVNDNTEIRGSINVGERVKVKARRQGNGQLIAISIEPIDGDGGGSGGNGSGDQPSTPAPQPSVEPTKGHGGDHGGSTPNPPPEPTESHGGDHGGSAPQPTKSPGDN